MLRIRRFGEFPLVRRAHTDRLRKGAWGVRSRSFDPEPEALGRLVPLPLHSLRQRRSRESGSGERTSWWHLGSYECRPTTGGDRSPLAGFSVSARKPPQVSLPLAAALHSRQVRWTIPALRMKVGREFAVPLSAGTLEVLNREQVLFPESIVGVPVEDRRAVAEERTETRGAPRRAPCPYLELRGNPLPLPQTSYPASVHRVHTQNVERLRDQCWNA